MRKTEAQFFSCERILPARSSRPMIDISVWGELGLAQWQREEVSSVLSHHQTGSFGWRPLYVADSSKPYDSGWEGP